MKLGMFAMVAVVALSLAASTVGAAGHMGRAYWQNPDPAVCPNPGAPDDDGDGIPNGQDPDYVPPRDGSGRQWGRSGMDMGPFWWLSPVLGPFGSIGVPSMSVAAPAGAGFGPGDCTGNGGDGPRDGTGYGSGPRRGR